MPGAFARILVPMKIGLIGEEVLGTAIKLAEEHGSALTALLLAAELGVAVEGVVVHSRAIGEAIVDLAIERSADLIVMGSSPRWRRQSRFFSPTVDHVLRQAPCEVMVIAYPQGVLEDEEVGVHLSV
jgi:nucleotide-binding universal stress UspA family protein